MELILNDCFDDLDALTEAVQHWDIDFRLLEAGGFVGRVKQIVSKDVLLSYARFERRLDQAGGIPQGFRTFVLPAAGCRGFWWRGYQVNTNDLLVFPDGSELRGKRFGLVMSYGDSDPYNSGAVNAFHTFRDMLRYLRAELVGIVYGSASAEGEIEQQAEVMGNAYQLGEKISS